MSRAAVPFGRTHERPSTNGWCTCPQHRTSKIIKSTEAFSHLFPARAYIAHKEALSTKSLLATYEMIILFCAFGAGCADMGATAGISVHRNVAMTPNVFRRPARQLNKLLIALSSGPRRRTSKPPHKSINPLRTDMSSLHIIPAPQPRNGCSKKHVGSPACCFKMPPGIVPVANDPATWSTPAGHCA